MNNLIVQLSKIILIILLALFTLEIFASMRYRKPKKLKMEFIRQRILFFLILLLGNGVLFTQTKDENYIILFSVEILFFIVFIKIYDLFYEKANKILINTICMLLVIGFIMQPRLNFTKSIKHIVFCFVAVILSALVPFAMQKIQDLKKYKWLYGGVGILLLGIVAVLGVVSYGAKLSISLGPISFQPSEFVKITFVFFVASMLYQDTSFKNIVITGFVAALHVLILVISNDLGGAFIYFFTFLIMLYVATRKIGYMALGLLAGSGAAMLAYHFFSHVRVRVLAWKDPFAVIDGAGFQISQSLFAIGTGGWFGLGLFEGMPNNIPVASEDFIFSAISEELGGIFAICLIFLCIGCFLLMLNIAFKIKNQFHKLIALGLGSVYGVQVFINIGGVIKMIPSTGVTLPFVSYGGSSLLSSFIMIAIIQGLYLLSTKKKGEQNE